MRGKRKLKVHWVNGVEEAHKNKTDQTPQHKKTKQPHQPTIKPQYKKTKQTTPDGVGEKKKSGVGESGKKVYRTLGG